MVGVGEHLQPPSERADTESSFSIIQSIGRRGSDQRSATHSVSASSLGGVSRGCEDVSNGIPRQASTSRSDDGGSDDDLHSSVSSDVAPTVDPQPGPSSAAFPSNSRTAEQSHYTLPEKMADSLREKNCFWGYFRATSCQLEF